MSSWPVQEAKARFSELLDKTLRNGPQVVTRRGVETAVLVPIEEWRRLRENQPKTLKEVLLGPGPRFHIPLPKRGTARHRPPVEFD